MKKAELLIETIRKIMMPGVACDSANRCVEWNHWVNIFIMSQNTWVYCPWCGKEITWKTEQSSVEDGLPEKCIDCKEEFGHPDNCIECPDRQRGKDETKNKKTPKI